MIVTAARRSEPEPAPLGRPVKIGNNGKPLEFLMA
jgi:hypothetical protein